MNASIIAADFDRARREMLAEFRALLAAHPAEARQEVAATVSAMLQLCILEALHAA